MLSIVFLPLSLYFLIVSAFQYRREHLKIKEAILQNEAFFKALMTLNFIGNKYVPSYFKAIMPVDENLSETDVQDIAQREIINVVLKFVKSEDLLRYLSVDTKILSGNVVFELKPASFGVVVNNLVNSVQSIIVYLTAFGAYKYFF